MYNTAYKYFSGLLVYKDSEANLHTRLLFALLFPVFTILALGIDSVAFQAKYFDGRQFTNIASIGYFLLFAYFSGTHLRRLMFVMVALSYIGELIFCKLLGMYAYKSSAIPLYVPFGHAIVYASGYVMAHTPFAKEKDAVFRKVFALGFGLLFVLAALFLNDIFTLLSGLLFFILLKRKRWQNMYYFIALCVIFIELAGTYFKCWVWEPKIFGLIPAANPPVGAVFFYAGGDVLLAKIVNVWEKRNGK